jgi:hypothetical protein
MYGCGARKYIHSLHAFYQLNERKVPSQINPYKTLKERMGDETDSQYQLKQANDTQKRSV